MRKQKTVPVIICFLLHSPIEAEMITVLLEYLQNAPRFETGMSGAIAPGVTRRMAGRNAYPARKSLHPDPEHTAPGSCAALTA
jgi:hypothetical protein